MKNHTSIILSLLVILCLSGTINTKGLKHYLNEISMSESSMQINAAQFAKEMLTTHNQLRKKHKAPALVLNAKITAISQQYANTLAKINKMQHSSNTFEKQPLGENLFMAWGMVPKADYATMRWYNEIAQYNFNISAYQPGTLHFSQVVWASSKQLGVGVAKSATNSYYVVANYYPAGNMISRISSNVFKG